MFRPTVVLIVLTIAVGPNVGTVCSWWCQPERPLTACEHRSTDVFALVSGASHCQAGPASLSVFWREVVAKHAYAPAMNCADTNLESERQTRSVGRLTTGSLTAGPPSRVTLRI